MNYNQSKGLSWDWKLTILVSLGGFIIPSIQKEEITFSFFSGYFEYLSWIGEYVTEGASFLFGFSFLFFFIIGYWYYTLLTIGIISIIFKIISGD